MTESPSTLDPRYDARFQRGYRPPAEDAAEAVEWAADAERNSAARRERMARGPDPAGTTATEVRQPERTEDAAPVAPVAAVADLSAETNVTAGRSVPPETSISREDAALDPAPVAPAPPGLAERVTARSLWLVLAAALVFVVAGVALVWNISMSRNPFVGARGDEDLLVDTLLQLAPSLVSVGCLGIVAVLLVWALKPASGTRLRGGR